MILRNSTRVGPQAVGKRCRSGEDSRSSGARAEASGFHSFEYSEGLKNKMRKHIENNRKINIRYAIDLKFISKMIHQKPTRVAPQVEGNACRSDKNSRSSVSRAEASGLHSCI